MITEKDMENAIAQNPKKYLGESGLELIERQHRIGGYIFDLLFKDRHGAALIVELQRGTLDREHTYKILDYYDGFREKHPDEFIELMVIANSIPAERKKRLHSWGVAFREVPESEFLSDVSGVTGSHSEPPSRPQPAARAVEHALSGSAAPAPSLTETRADDDVTIDTATWNSYRLFKEQKNRFVEALPNGTVDLRMNWKELSRKNIRSHTNWFIGFIPKAWGVFKGSFGVHFTFAWYRDRKTGIEHVRFPVGVEMPLRREFHVGFKDDVVAVLGERRIALPGCALWPHVGFGKAKLLEPSPVALDDQAWETVLNRYLELDEFIQVVADVIRQYHARGCFAVDLEFP